MSSTRDTEFRRFLLGTASDAESEAYVLRILQSADADTDAGTDSDAALLEALSDEDDLIDDYVRGELDADSTERFESLVLRHPEGRRRVAFARALAQRAREEAARDVTAMTPTPADDASDSADDDGSDSVLGRFLAGFQGAVARPAWALCLLLLALAAVQTYRLAVLSATVPTTEQVSEPHSEVDTSRLAKLEAEADDLRRRLDASRGEIESLRTDLDAARNAASDAASDAARSLSRSTSPRAVSALLAAATRSAAIPAVTVPRDTDVLELEIDLAGVRAAEGLRARLLDADDFQVWGDASAEAEGDPGALGLHLQIPAEDLSAGPYTLLLERARPGDGSWSELDRYEFRVTRP